MPVRGENLKRVVFLKDYKKRVDARRERNYSGFAFNFLPVNVPSKKALAGFVFISRFF
jgi:hypothetical protein